jgi:DNA invertase Pin-like site-specific DNA recombinase
VAAYCRVSSTSDDQLSSYQAQLRNYDHYIRSRPDFTLIGIFADEGISGTDLKKRTAFNEMMHKAREGQIDLIITKSISRFGRNTLDCLKCIRELKQLNVDVFFEKENVHSNNKDGEILLTLISAVAQNESLNQSENVKWGIRRKYERKLVRSIPSGKFLGYRKDGQGNLSINEEQATIVRRIYSAFLHGLGAYQIATMLTKENVPMTYGGKEWCASHILKVLTNEKYQGDTRFQKTFNTDYLTKHRAKNRGQLPQPYLKDSHPAIIDRKTWLLVQLEIERQKQFVECHCMDKFHHHSEEYPLSGKIFCQTCGQPFALRQSTRTRNYGQKYWVCRGHRAGRYGPVGPDCCRNDHRISVEEVERLIVRSWNELADRRRDLLRPTNKTGDELADYRIRDLKRQVQEYSHLRVMPYALLIRVLDHVEIRADGKLSVIFLAGIRMHG